MMIDNTVLSLNPDGRILSGQESALRESGFTVISVSTPVQARFEIQMGRGGIFLLSYLSPPLISVDLIRFFKEARPQGIVAFISQREKVGPDNVQILLTEEDEPRTVAEAILALRAEAS